MKTGLQLLTVDAAKAIVEPILRTGCPIAGAGMAKGPLGFL